MRLLKSIIPLFFVGLFIASCEDEDQKSNLNELSEYSRKYVGLQMGGARNSAAADLSIGNPINQSFQRLFGQASGFTGGRTAGDSTNTSDPGSGSDSTIVDTPWETCATITTVTNDDGSVTTTYDYGDGCEDGNEWFKYWMHGKFTNTYRATQHQSGSKFYDSYFYESLYDNYGGSYTYDTAEYSWNMDGGSTYTGESEYDSTLKQYKGGYAYSDETTYTWDNVEYQYIGSGKTTYDETKYVVEKNNYQYISGSDYYKTTVLEPLVSKYDCNPYANGEINACVYFMVYVSGRERIEYKQGDETGVFEIDYGHGECDRIITIIENGKRVDIDLGKDIIAF